MEKGTCETVSGARAAAALLSWIVLLAVLMALLEIQIEGAQGWAAGLPTWRLADAPRLKWLFGDRDITGYHVFLFGFMGAVFHFPIVLYGRFSWRVETRILGSLMLFWLLEDAMWFALNPAYGLSGLNPRQAAWHAHWWGGWPADYYVFLALGGFLLGLSYRQKKKGGAG